jgi:hypothetical protein
MTIRKTPVKKCVQQEMKLAAILRKISCPKKIFGLEKKIKK